MNIYLENIKKLLQGAELTENQKQVLLKAVTDADKQWSITDFKLDRTEKVKKTTAILLEETIEELEQKRKAVEAQNEELEIESALERVRTVAMSMNKQDDMLHVCSTIAEQLALLKVKEIRNVQTAIIYKDKGIYMNYEYYAKHNKPVTTEVDYNLNKEHSTFANRMLKGAGEFYTRSFKGKALKDWYADQKTTNVFIDDYLNTAASLNYYFYSLGPVVLGISTYVPLTDDEINLFKRFLKVFELSYRRYLDIEKAIAQSREAEIALALERVRARTMAMQKSDELAQTAYVLFQQFEQLGENPEQLGIGIFNEPENVLDLWTTINGKLREKSVMVSLDEPIVIRKLYTAWKEEQKTLVIDISGKALEQYNAYRNSLSGIKMESSRLKDRRVISIAYFSKGALSLATSEPKPPETLQLLERFANVFDLTYTRFLDLQKAEAQAREAKIEAALERTRTQSMVMQHSKELDDTLRVFHQQVQLLGINSAFSFLWLPNEEKEQHIFWAIWEEDKNGAIDFKNKAVNYPLDRNEPATAQCLIDWKGNEPVVSYAVPPEGVKNYFAAWQELIDGVEKLTPEHFAGGLYYVEAFMKYGCFGVMLENDLTADEKKILGRFAIEFERTYTRFLDLQKAEAQAREAQIETGLERVRSRSLAMHNTSELQEVIHTVHKELLHLNIAINGGSFIAINNDVETRLRCWGSGGTADTSEEVKLPLYEKPFCSNLINNIKKGPAFFTEAYTQEEKKDFFTFLFQYEPWSKLDVKQQEETLLSPGGYARSCYVSQHTTIFIVNHFGEKFSAADNDILKRFGKVFEQTYTRFLDLQKAEAQAREAEIELALERVRARTMAMQHSDELAEASLLLDSQVRALGIKTRGCAFNIYGDNESTEWFSSEMGTMPTYKTPREKLFLRYYNEGQTGKPIHVETFAGEACINHYDYLCTLPVLGEALRNLKASGGSFPVQQVDHVVYFKYGYLLFITLDPVPEAHDVFIRFAKVFEQTYTRFLDLQKAEAQAREATIESALERVRSVAMSMMKSADLGNAVAVVFEELDKLKLGIARCGIGILSKEKRSANVWTTSNTAQGNIVHSSGDESMDIHPLLHNQFEAWLKKDSFSYTLEGDDLIEYYKAVGKTNLNLPEQQTTLSTNKLAKQFYHASNFTSGGVFAFRDTEFTGEAKSVMKRFANVFDLTYQRFLDLQKAEAQAREAQIETALERVRSRTLAMQKSDELAETASEVFKQLMVLGIEPNRLYIGIVNADTKEMEMWATDEDGTRVGKKFSFFADDNDSVQKLYDGWLHKKKSVTVDMQGAELDNYIAYLQQLKIPLSHALTQKKRVQSVAYFDKGFIGMASPDDQSQDSIQLLERFAAVFNLTFTRFNDLKIAEAHAEQAVLDLIKLQTEKKRAEDALGELRATQTQLIQSEKMASLGELTAGIAHEIQNPLNFVNNFSEVSKELLDEMKEAMEKGDTEEAKEIMNDVIQNLEKINHHGKRADGIVKGMLQHSRSSSGQKELTDINILCDEYLRLAYHGLRAKDKSFNATLKTEYDETLEKINIIPQDIGRVVLNLITNAFYAVGEKKKLIANSQQPLAIYEPTVTVSTKKLGAKFLITVTDNGNGIPQNIIDKIFQPFFTTKPTGQGTGLGLSLAYDIVKAHGGEMKVETKVSEGSIFIIELPKI